MPRRPRNPLLRLSLQRSLTRSFGAITRTMVRAGTQAIGKPAAKRKPVTKREPAASPRRAAQSAAASVGPSRSGMAIGSTTTLRYQLYKPPGAKRGEQLPLMVMLHGCTQDGAAIAASSRMNSIAARERFMVLYPQQSRMANAHGCWNWFDTRNGRAQREADAIAAAINQVCLTQPVDANCIAIAGFSAGAGMAALVASRQPGRFKAVAMHSGIGPGEAQSSATALRAMRGRAGPRVERWCTRPVVQRPHRPRRLAHDLGFRLSAVCDCLQACSIQSRTIGP
jgi:poly(hydroxyalkanoate) depolymerase family esterase